MVTDNHLQTPIVSPAQLWVYLTKRMQYSHPASKYTLTKKNVSGTHGAGEHTYHEVGNGKGSEQLEKGVNGHLQ